MTLAGLDDLTMRLAEKRVAEAERLLRRARIRKDAAVGRDAHDGAQHGRRDAEAGIARDHCLPPRTADGVVVIVGAEGVDQDIDVRQDHLKRFMRFMESRSSRPWISENRVRSMPGRNPPVVLLIGGMTRFVLPGLRSSVVTSRKPSSISEVSVRPSDAALRLAREIRSSGRRMVVRSVICLDIRRDGYARQRAAGPAMAGDNGRNMSDAQFATCGAPEVGLRHTPIFSALA